MPTCPLDEPVEQVEPVAIYRADFNLDCKHKQATWPDFLGITTLGITALGVTILLVAYPSRSL